VLTLTAPLYRLEQRRLGRGRQARAP
jgi:hypothetical protein